MQRGTWSLQGGVVESREATQTVIDLTADWFPRPSDPGAELVDELAFAGFARCRRLLEGMIELYDASDVCGILARTLFETWVTSVYLLLGRDDAFQRVKTNDDLHLYKFAKRFAEAFGES